MCRRSRPYKWRRTYLRKWKTRLIFKVQFTTLLFFKWNSRKTSKDQFLVKFVASDSVYESDIFNLSRRLTGLNSTRWVKFVKVKLVKLINNFGNVRCFGYSDCSKRTGIIKNWGNKEEEMNKEISDERDIHFLKSTAKRKVNECLTLLEEISSHYSMAI